jgi:hypothetical protein
MPRLVVVPLLLLALPLAFLLIPVWLPIATAAQSWREHRFRRRMRAAGRFVDWPGLRPRLERGEGTLIVEQAQKDACRVWWTDENVRRLAGTLRPPDEAEMDYLRLDDPDPFVWWCHRPFTAADGGSAFLTRPPYKHPPGFVEASFFREKFPSLPIVMTVKQP